MSETDEQQETALRRPRFERNIEQRLEPLRRDREDIEKLRAAAAPLPRRHEDDIRRREERIPPLREKFFNAVKKVVLGTDGGYQEFSVETQEKVTVMPVIKFKMAFGTA